MQAPRDPELQYFPENASSEAKLRHQRQGHVPYWSECPSCVRSKGLSPAKTRPTLDPLEVQLDQYFYCGVKLIAIVHVATYCVGTATTFSREARGETVRNLVKFLRSFGLKQVHLIHDGEHEIVDVTGGSSTSTKASPSRHAPVAERAIRNFERDRLCQRVACKRGEQPSVACE